MTGAPAVRPASAISHRLISLPIVHPDGTTITLARDGQKGVRAEIADNGTTVNRSLRYAAYGAINAFYAGSTPTPLGYAGQLYDPTGLYYMRARWYDPASARFIRGIPSASVRPPRRSSATRVGIQFGTRIRAG